MLKNKHSAGRITKRRFSRFFRKPILLAILAVVVVGGGVLAWTRSRQESSPTIPQPTESETINVVANPPTEQEKQAVEEHKDQIANQQNNPPASSSGKKQVSVTITSVNTGGGIGYVSGVIENGGTCTLTLTRGSEKYSGTSKGMADAGTTTCPYITVSGAIGSGWSAILSYESNSSTGVSAAKII